MSVRGSPVRGRAAEALALLVESDQHVESIPDLDDGAEDGDVPSFITDRVRFLQERLDDTQPNSGIDRDGANESVRERTGDVVDEMTSPADGECPHSSSAWACMESSPPGSYRITCRLMGWSVLATQT